MKRFEVNGAEVKRLREEREKRATQKEFAYEIRICERRLRAIENGKLKVTADVLDRMSRAFEVPRDQLRHQESHEVPSNGVPPAQHSLADRFVPRFDTAYADVVTNEADLFEAAVKSQVVVLQLLRPLSQETEGYVAELFEFVSSLCWRGANRAQLGTVADLELRKRTRELLVLLKGNDVWLYKTDNFKLLPERHAIPEERDPFDCEVQLILAVGPPGEYGETSIQVAVDNGQPRHLRY